MRRRIAEHFADILMMNIELGTKIGPAHGSKEVLLPLDADGDFELPFKVKIAHSADWHQLSGDAAMVLEGPGNLLLFIAFKHQTRRILFAVVDKLKLKLEPGDILDRCSGADDSLGEFRHAVVKAWFKKTTSGATWKALGKKLTH